LRDGFPERKDKASHRAILFALQGYAPDQWGERVCPDHLCHGKVYIELFLCYGAQQYHMRKTLFLQEIQRKSRAEAVVRLYLQGVLVDSIAFA